jgi:hypothetical protein
MADTETADISILVAGYSEQLQTTIEGLRQRGTTLGQDMQAQANLDTVKATIEPRVQAVQAQITDLSPATNPASARALNVYILSALTLTTASVGHVLGAFILSPVIGLLFSGTLASVSAYVLLPAYTAHYSTSQADLSESSRNSLVVAAGLGMGVLSGHALSGCYLSYVAPPTVLLPVSLAVTSAYLGAKLGANRAALIGVAVGAPVAAELLLGLATGSLGGSFLLYTLTTGVLYAAGMQLVLANEEHQVTTQTLSLVAATLALQGALTFITAYSHEGYQEMRAAQHSN